MTVANPIDISVVICTRDRADSLRQTLNGLAGADRTGLRVEVVVVDNGSTPSAREAALSFAPLIPVRYLVEPTTGTYGKSHALNAALEVGNLGSLIVILDDDMSVAPAWWLGIAALSARWPQADLFSGAIHLIWPPGLIPPWARNPLIQGWIFSVSAGGEQDIPLADGLWFSGNFFWFRSRVLSPKRRFDDTWFTEARFQLQLIADGFVAISGPGAVAGHRVQASLLDPKKALERARISGLNFANTRLSPCRATVKNARWARSYPLAARIYCLAAWCGWSLCGSILRLVPPSSGAFAQRLLALERQANYREAIRLLCTERSYRILNLRPE